ncbi:MAG: thioredoxin domain-containing protein [Longimicrobiales bacterium]
MPLEKLNDQRFYEETEKCGGMMVVDFGAPWCGPCKALHPMVEELAEEMAGEARFFEVSIDDAPRVAQRYGIRSLPTVGFFVGEEKVGAVIGLKPKAALKEAIRETLQELAQGESVERTS